jgi:GAF domain-containing protein
VHDHPERRVADMISVERLSFVFAEVADVLVSDFDLMDFLHELTSRAADVSGAASVGLLLADQHDFLHFMAASTETARLLELFQLQNEQGPCLDCFHAGRPVVSSDLGSADDRWPMFAPRARELGFGSVHAFPMQVRGRVIGALNVFGTEPLDFSPSEVRLVQSLADMATIAIFNEPAVVRAGSLTEQLQVALNSRVVIEQAKGAMAEVRGVDVDEAFLLMRAAARASGRHLGQVARAILADPRADPGAALCADSGTVSGADPGLAPRAATA